MRVRCWGKSPEKICQNVATRYFVSKIPETPGINPANRAVCQDCFGRFCFDFFVRIGEVEEVSEIEWQENPKQASFQERITV